MSNRKKTWQEVVANALDELGGQAELKQIYEYVEQEPENQLRFNTNQTWQATIRYTLQQYKTFEPVERGIWRLAETTNTLPQVAMSDFISQDDEFDHDMIQGMLIALGKIYGYETFVPKNDQTMRMFQDSKLSDIVTLNTLDGIFSGQNERDISQIDVLWFDEDDHGLFPVYAFEVEHTTRVKSGLDRLLKIPRRYKPKLFIVAPGETERKIFERLISKTPFKAHSDRFSFRTYSQLSDLYNSAVRYEDCRSEFGVSARYSEYI
jgi:hypothetical protein